MNAAAFVDELALLDLPDTFNPWRDTCPEYDVVDAPAIRRRNILQVLDRACHYGADHLWVGRDLGYLGGRRTGLAMTDDLRLADHARMWGLTFMTRATHGSPKGERTAREIWSWLPKLSGLAFLWNVSRCTRTVATIRTPTGCIRGRRGRQPSTSFRDCILS